MSQTEEDDRDETGARDGDDDRESSPGDPLRSLLRRSLEASPPVKKGAILRGVQRKIRQRSRGRFFATGWATSTRVSYLSVALVMLVVLVVAFLGLGPLGIK